MTIKQFPPRDKTPGDETKAEQPGGVSVPKPKAVPAKSVTFFQGDDYALNFSGAHMVLGISSEAFPQNRGPQGLAAVKSSAEETADLISLLDLEPSAVQAIDAIAKEHDLTFVEATRFHLAMTLPG